MRSITCAALGLMTLAAAGCNKPAENQPAPAPDNPKDIEYPAAPSTAPRVVRDEPQTRAEPADKGTPGFRSAYTEIPQTGCKRISFMEEGASAVYQCAGHAGIPLFVKDGDARSDVDAGAEGEFHSRGEFNSAGDTVEWRIGPDGKPFAIIYRLISAMEDRPRQTWLVAETIGTSAKPPCRIAEIAGSTANANAVARAAADLFLTENQPCPAN